MRPRFIVAMGFAFGIAIILDYPSTLPTNDALPRFWHHFWDIFLELMWVSLARLEDKWQASVWEGGGREGGEREVEWEGARARWREGERKKGRERERNVCDEWRRVRDKCDTLQQPQQTEGPRYVLVAILNVVYAITSCILLLNFLIAMMGRTFQVEWAGF